MYVNRDNIWKISRITRPMNRQKLITKKQQSGRSPKFYNCNKITACFKKEENYSVLIRSSRYTFSSNKIILDKNIMTGAVNGKVKSFS